MRIGSIPVYTTGRPRIFLNIFQKYIIIRKNLWRRKRWRLKGQSSIGPVILDVSIIIASVRLVLIVVSVLAQISVRRTVILTKRKTLGS